VARLPPSAISCQQSMVSGNAFMPSSPPHGQPAQSHVLAFKVARVVADYQWMSGELHGVNPADVAGRMAVTWLIRLAVVGFAVTLAAVLGWEPELGVGLGIALLWVYVIVAGVRRVRGNHRWSAQVAETRRDLSPAMLDAIRAQASGLDIGPDRRQELLQLISDDPAAFEIYQAEVVRIANQHIEPGIQSLLRRFEAGGILAAREVDRIVSYFAKRPDSLQYLSRTKPDIAAAVSQFL